MKSLVKPENDPMAAIYEEFAELDIRQAELVRHLRTFLKPGGAFLATTIVRGGISTSGLDLWGAMTTGASRLADPDELVARLREAGLVDVACRKIGQDGMYRAFIGREPHQP